jgi:beta-mannosidase
LELPANPKIESNLTKAADGYALTLQSAVLARSVNISFGELDVQLSDNYFDLLPGEAVTVTLRTSASLDELQKAAKVLSLTDAYASQAAHY